MRTLLGAVVLGLGCVVLQPAPPAGFSFNPGADLDPSGFTILAPAHTRQGVMVGEAIGCSVSTAQ